MSFVRSVPQYPGYGYIMFCTRPELLWVLYACAAIPGTSGSSCNTSTPVPETSGSSVRPPYPYPEFTNPTKLLNAEASLSRMTIVRAFWFQD